MSRIGLPGRSGVGAPLPNPTGQSPRPAVVSNARAEASRKNGAKSRGPKTEEGRARSSQNALKHGMRAQKYVVLPEEDADEFAGLEAALVAELAPVGAFQAVLARRVAVAAWRLARADRIEVELFAERHIAGGGLGLALIRDGNGTRSFETLLRYRGAAMAEFWRALRTLKALQAEQAATPMGASAPRPPIARRLAPNEPEHRMEYVLPEPPMPGRTLHEAATPPWPPEPNGPDSRSNLRESDQPGARANASSALREREPDRMHVRPLPRALPTSGAPALQCSAPDRQR
jgi:hypothetical protein